MPAQAGIRRPTYIEAAVPRDVRIERPVSAKTETEAASGTQEMTERGYRNNGQKEEHAEQ